MADHDTITIMNGLTIEIVVSSEASDNTCCVFIETTPPGSGPPPHKHLREEEIFTVLDGDYEFFAEGAWTPLEIGRSVLSRRGTHHAFRNVGRTPGRIMLMTNNGGIDAYFRAISRLTMPDDAGKLREISAHYGYVYLEDA